ncbi:hypothetical protein [Chitinophaga sedimenti]|uniref:hypothetical protein n=1 Tax=Chitinophaga sedimenti TaxID=2033606 RepID=UPI00249F59A2|nr:hypothetical protein [Chitinophaga sedimenti]
MLETPMGDFRLSPAYDLLNSRIHIKDKDFALDDGLLPKKLAKGKISEQFAILANHAGIPEKTFDRIITTMTSGSEIVEKLTAASFMEETTRRNYLQSYQARLKQMEK